MIPDPFWERAFLARASTNGGLAPSAAAQDCADFANSAVFQESILVPGRVERQKEEPENTARKSAERVPGA